MSDRVRLACQPEIFEIAISKILPIRRLNDDVVKSVKYQCIEASVRELGLIEPLMIFPQPDTDGAFMLLDGHIRLMILKALGVATAKCLISLDDEGFTYNHKVNRLTAIQEHFMILRAIKDGVSEDRIARTLNVDIQTIRRKRDLLEGICPEAVQLLREKRATPEVFRELRKVKATRQIEIAELMCAAHNYSVGYSKCLVAASPAEQLIDSERGKDIRGLSPEDISRIEHEMETHGREFKLIEESLAKNTLNLVIVGGYLHKLLDNSRTTRYLTNHHAEIFGEFKNLDEARTFADTEPMKIDND